MKKIFITCIMLLLLSSCFWGNTDTKNGLILHDREDFSILIPDSWQQLDSSDIPTPKSWEVELAYSSQSERQWYLNNIVVIKSPLIWEKTNQSLIKSSLVYLEKNIKNFSLISEKNLTFPDESTWTIITYSGRYNSSTPEAVYIQSAKICSDSIYNLTLSLAEKIESYERYEYILQTFRCN